MQDYFQIGVITSSHGLKGELNVYPTTNDPARFLELSNICLSRSRISDKAFDDKLFVEYEIRDVKISGKKVILSLDGIHNRNDSDDLKGRYIVIKREDAIILEEDEFFIADLIGCIVHDKVRGKLGELTDIISTGSNDVYIVDSEKYGQILIPALKDVILQTRIDEEIIMVDLPRGLIDD